MKAMFKMAALAFVATATAAGAKVTTVLIPAPSNQYDDFKGNNTSITVDGVKFATPGYLFVLGTFYSPAGPTLFEEIGNPAFTITLPKATRSVSLQWGDYYSLGDTVTFALSNGKSYSYAASSTAFGVPNLFTATTSKSFDTVTVSGYSYYGSIGTLTYGAVPEAATWVMMVAGFGLVGAATRRRQVALAA